ncbi:MAG: oligosaccharide flippase family protein [Rhizobiales bacterium]|nr:oligosaccharide flippase family protein [Hyphomicrobiales bacterium]
MKSLAAFLRQSGDLRRFGSGLIWSTVGTVAVRLTPLLTTVLISRGFGIEVVGQFAVAYGTLVSAGMLAATGVSLMAIRNIAAQAEQAPEFAGRIAGLALMLAAACGLILSGLFYFLADVIAAKLLRQPEMAPYLALIAPIILLNAMSQVQMSILSGLQQFRSIARLNIVYGVVLILAVPAGLYLGGLTGCFIAMAGAALGLCIIAYPAMRSALAERGITITFAGALSEWPLITNFAVPALLASIVFEPVNWICTAIIVSMPGGLKEVGVYYIAMQVETLLLFVPQIVVQVVIPMLSKGFGARDRGRVLSVIGMSVGTNFVIALGFVGAMLLFGHWVLMIFKLDAAHWPVFAIAVANAAIMSVALPLGPIPASSGYTWTGLTITAGWAATFIAGTWLMREQGAEGAMTARMIAWSAQSVIYVFFTRYAVRKVCDDRAMAAAE